MQPLALMWYAIPLLMLFVIIHRDHVQEEHALTPRKQQERIAAEQTLVTLVELV